MFNGCTKLGSIIFADDFETHSCTNYARLFNNCTSLRSIVMKGFHIGSSAIPYESRETRLNKSMENVTNCTIYYSELPDGDYTLTLKVWDIYNNSGTATIDFTVVNNSGILIENLFNAPNPVTDETHFVFDHNQGGNNMKVDIYIFDIMGRWVTTLSQVVSGSSTRVDPIRWDGRSAQGSVLRNGVYVYRVVATNDQGETATMVSKLVLSK